MSRNAGDPFHEAASALTPSAVSRFLATRNWQLETRQPQVMEVWRHRDETDGRSAPVMLPLATDYGDFHRRFRDALESLSYVHGWDAHELKAHIAASEDELAERAAAAQRYLREHMGIDVTTETLAASASLRAAIADRRRSG